MHPYRLFVLDFTVEIRSYGVRHGLLTGLLRLMVIRHMVYFMILLLVPLICEAQKPKQADLLSAASVKQPSVTVNRASIMSRRGFPDLTREDKRP